MEKHIMLNSENKDNFLKLVYRYDSSTMDEVKFRMENREMLRESQSIALKILTRLDDLNWDVDHFSRIMYTTTQNINEILSGRMNFDIQTLLQIQKVLDIPLLASYYDKK